MISLSAVQDKLDTHLRTVDELAGFDSILLDFCISHINDLNFKLKNGPPQISNQTYLAENALKAISNVRQNNSMRIQYKSIFNSCLVLQVSYFTSAVEAIFHYTINRLITSNKTPYTIEALKQKNNINFQNMASTIKTYCKYLNLEIIKNSTVNNISLAQCCRHTIVHSLSIADQKFISQTQMLTPRDIKRNMTLDEKIFFSSSELQFVKLAMQTFISDLCDKIKAQLEIE